MYLESLAWLKKYNLLRFDEIDGTNAEALRLARAGVTGNYIIWAGSQTDGRGKNGKYWHSESGNLFVSLLISDIGDEKIPFLPEASLVAALAVQSTVAWISRKNGRKSLDVKLKWPNDVMVGDKKIAGILIESVTFKGINYLIVGVGINNKNSPSGLEKPPTSLAEEGVVIGDESEILSLFVNFFRKYFSIWYQKGMMNIRRRWISHAYKLGKTITVDDGAERISGEFTDLDLQGNIQLTLSDGRIVSLSCGEVFFPR